MKNRLGLVVLVLLCVGLGIALMVTNKHASDQLVEDAKRIGDYSNDLSKVRFKLDEQLQVNAKFEKDLESKDKSLSEMTNNVTRLNANLTDVSANLSKTEENLKTTQQEVAKRDAKITDLENQNHQLDKQALELSGAITNLTTQIADTQRKLSASEGDKAFLEGELKRLMSEKAELERQFNDLSVLRAQVAKLKEELNIARRIDWIRQGLFASSDQKGAQKLMQGVTVPQAPKVQKASYDLNVEVHSDGTVKVIPPLKDKTTNAPVAK